MIRVEGLEKRYGGAVAVQGVSFEVAEGELVALLGPSGGGKTTVLRMIAGLEAPDRGRVFLRGADATDVPVQARRIGFVFQHYALFRHMNVRDNVAFGLEVAGTPRAAARRKADELLETVQLPGLGDRFPAQLSGGQRQRVALARALAPEPSILLLDEPFGALDAKVRLELRAWLRRLQRERGVTCVFVTHDQDEAMELADRVVIVSRGRVEQVGAPAEVYDRPATAFVASFIGTSNVLTGVVREGKLEALGMALSAGNAREGEAQAFVRHHHVEVVGRAEGDAADGITRATIARLARVGWLAKLELTLPDGGRLQAELPRDRADSLGLAEGQAVFVSLRDASVFVEDYVI